MNFLTNDEQKVGCWTEEVDIARTWAPKLPPHCRGLYTFLLKPAKFLIPPVIVEMNFYIRNNLIGSDMKTTNQIWMSLIAVFYWNPV